jgi:protease IV
LNDALQSAAKRAKLPADFRTQYIETEPGRLDRLLQGFGLNLQSAMGTPAELTPDVRGALVALGLLPPAVAQMANDLAWLGDLAGDLGTAPALAHKPFAFSAVVHCLCQAP